MKPIVIIIMDGFGMSSEKKTLMTQGSPERMKMAPTAEPFSYQSNAIAKAEKPNLEEIWKNYPTTTLGCAGLAVGLPRGQMGNSEVGHLNLGSGRIVYQDYTRISLAVEEGSICKNPVLSQAMESSRKGKLHLLGLLSDGGVHSHNTHLYALLEMAKKAGLEKVFVHAILDGRDVPPKSALNYFRELEERFERLNLGRVATVSGRYYTMDRDKRWDRVEKAYRCLVEGEGFEAETAAAAVTAGYDRGESDEFLKPTVVDKAGLVADGDSIIFFNFRPDRAREISRAFVDKDFKEFPTSPLRVHYTCMTQYDATLRVPVAFPPQDLQDTLGEVVSRAGLHQLRIAETEKYAHVTYFFNGGREEPNPGEDRVLIPSPKVTTYDIKPDMSAHEVTDEVIRRIRSGVYDLMVLNYANPDMVGHTGILEAAVKAVETVDTCVGRVVKEVLAQGGAVLLTADHGNAEKMQDEITGQPHTAHTTNPVPFTLIINDGAERRLRENGILADVAPTVLELLRVQKPVAMTGKSLIVAS